MPLVPPPYEELAPDGRQYFKILGVPTHLIRMYELLLQAGELAMARPDPTGKVQADQIDALILSVKRRVDADARATAIEADRLIRQKIHATRVRPPTLGVKNHQSSLISGIESRPVPSILPGGGAVGIADVQMMVHATMRPSANSRTPYYWRAQEFGSTHLVGTTIFGAFQPGDAPPSPDEFRKHPVFTVKGSSIALAGGGGVIGGRSFPMTIKNPIPERAFLREGAWEAYLFRKRLFEVTEQAAIDVMRRIGSSGLAGRP